ncbi:MAG: DMT family transporter [Verrucomicrobia bacterium]|nr:DMT family transporter [Verrucomicrobiota bacterium]
MCFQWALATTPSALVQPIVAMTPLVVIPFAYWFEGDKPSPRQLGGALISVLGVIALAFA